MKATVFQYAPGGTTARLHHTRTTESVYWSPRRPTGGGFNSYVLVESDRGLFEYDSKRVDLASINGMGEVRWIAHQYEIEYALRVEAKGEEATHDAGEIIGAARHFGLVPLRRGPRAVVLDLSGSSPEAVEALNELAASKGGVWNR